MSSTFNPSIRHASLNCTHLPDILSSKNTNVLEAYTLACNLARADLSHRSISCQTCSNSIQALVCLNCGYTGCEEHMTTVHAKESGHLLSANISTPECSIFCASCARYCSNRKLIKRAKIQPSKSDSLIPGYQATTGLRGIYNMGATCFISVILQVLIHNPIVRNFFLAGGHDRLECSRRNSCLACCLDGLFSDFYSSNSVQGYGISSFLIASFNARKSFSGASEQDAHEFLQFFLDELHKSDFVSSVFANIDNYDVKSQTQCNCISHRCFYGKLESRIKCDDCGYMTTTVDPMLDLSLGIKSFTNKNPVTLIECLDKFTSPEKLDVPFFCKQCGTRKPVKKRLCVKRLPPVLCFQLKVCLVSALFFVDFFSLFFGISRIPFLTSVSNMLACRQKLKHQSNILYSST